MSQAHAPSFVIDGMQAAADFLGPGAIETPKYESEIVDLVRRRGVLGQRMKMVPATGHPSRYFEQVQIVPGEFQDPRILQFNPGNQPTRRERAVMLKAIYGSINFGIFDVEVTRQQGQFAMLVAKDLTDTIQGVLRTSDKALWRGTDTDLVNPTTLEYVGALNQINRTATIASSASIIDGLKAEIASLVANENYDVQPSAIYVHPVLGDLIDQEERLNHRQLPQTTINSVTGGVVVNALATQGGHIPIIPEPYLPGGTASTTESGKNDYKAAILMESMVECHYLTTPEPRVFTLGLEGNLATRYSVVYFNAPVFKGKSNVAQAQNVTESGAVSYSHSVVTVVR